MARELDVDGYVEGVLAGDRTVLAQAITLIESRKPQHKAEAQTVLQQLLPHSGRSRRVGITGIPGVGKSTFIDTLGTNLTSAGRQVAVLAVDPSSTRTGGSILGDKTRMEHLAVDPRAFIRPSPSSGTLGGVTRTTRETIVLVEAAGFDTVLVETVGVGQSETVVADMVDFFLVLMIPGAGDELQGIKKGLLEMADLVAINKADGDNLDKATRAASEYRHAIDLMTPSDAVWTPPVLTCSALNNTGLDELWARVEAHEAQLSAGGYLLQRRREQEVGWMWQMVEDQLRVALRERPEVAELLPDIEDEVRDGRITPSLGAERILDAFGL